MKPQPKSKLCYAFAGSHKKDIGKFGYPSKTAHESWGEEYRLPDNITKEDLKKRWNPPYHADDVLYVRETWCLRFDGEKYFYKADKHTPREEKRLIDYDHVSWKPSIHMPKEAARIFLKVKYVRVERLQEITADQARAEGCDGRCECPGSGTDGSISCITRDFSIEKFETVWDSTIKKSELERYGWYANPWVWVIEFERIEVEND